MMKSEDAAPSKLAVSASAAALAAANKSRPSTSTSTTSTSTSTTTSARPAALSASSSSSSRPANKPTNTGPVAVEKATLTMSDEQSTERAYGNVSEENWTALADANWKTRLQGTLKRGLVWI